jgi:hypothetical protein
MIQSWTPIELKKLQEYYEEQLKEAEDEIENSSYPPDEQRRIDINEHVISLLEDMMNETSWSYKYSHSLFNKK